MGNYAVYVSCTQSGFLAT